MLVQLYKFDSIIEYRQYFTMNTLTVLTCLELVLLTGAQVTSGPENATREFTEFFGYPTEEYTVQTSDGYLLKLYRITGSPTSAPAEGKKVAMVIHGYWTTSIDWVKLGPNQSLPCILADEGYEVWLPNTRGNTLSRKHVSLSPNDPEFWDFTMHEVGVYDLPTVIDFALTTSGQQKLHYIGWSGSTNAFLALGSTIPSYMSKIQSAHLLSPASYYTHAFAPAFRAISPLPGMLGELFRVLGAGEFLPDSPFVRTFTAPCLKNTTLTDIACTNVLFLFAGYGSTQLDPSQMDQIFRYMPAGVSTKACIHVAQLTATTKYRQYDYGFFGNLLNYGSFSPPEYKLSQVNAPVALWSGDSDWLSSPIDANRLASALPSVKNNTVLKNWNHVDMIWAKEVKPLLYDKIVQVMKANE